MNSTKWSSKAWGPLFGLELEIEDILGWKEDNFIGSHVDVVNDGSLRNNGKEFILPPFSYSDCINGFNSVHAELNLGIKPFSERTSIHVHVNCSNLTVKEILAFIHLYIITEPLWMKFVGPKRANSIFCVPLYTTTLPLYYNRGLKVMHGNWHKYTAFNILPLSKLGTIEFRHLYGTSDAYVFTTWLSAINELMKYVRSTPDFNVIDILMKDNIVNIARKLFTPEFLHNMYDDEINELCNPTMLDLKLAFLD
jgi:hypothetical protein